MTVVLERKPKAKPLPRFVPVIFANGEDDDAPGLQAAGDNEAVQYGDAVYEPGDAITISDKTLILAREVFLHTRHRRIALTRCLIRRIK